MAINYRVQNFIGTIEFDQPDSKVNILSFEVMKKLDEVLEKIRRESNVKAVVIVSKKRDIFIAGADIKEIEGITETTEAIEKSKAGQRVFDKLEDLPVPTIAVIDGTALGGGCELALACRFRVATFNEKIRIGLPEVNLGILPGFGGTYRLPKLIGLTEALKIIVAGSSVASGKALKIGLVDRLFPQVGLEENVARFVEEILRDGGSRKKFPRKKKQGFEALLENTILGRRILFDQTSKSVMKNTKGFYPAPIKAIEVIRHSYGLKRGVALDVEAEGFGKLGATAVSKNLIKVFYLTEKYKKVAVAGAENLKPQPIQKCAVIGAGIMGGGIAQILSQNEIWVRLKDINQDAIAKGYAAAYKVFKQAVARRKMNKAEMDMKMAKITSSLDYTGFHNVDMIIEAVVEDMNIKKKVFKDLSDNVSENTILATNTSALSVTEMAQQVKDPSRVVGLHFFNPVHRMPLIEIVKTEYTSAQTLLTTLELVKRLKKTPIVVKDKRGFLVNRILLCYINEAGRLLEEGETVEAIDKIMTDFGMPMGPFTLSDEVGLDVGVKVLHILNEAFGDLFKPTATFEKVYKNGLLGKKVGKGFYIHGKTQRTHNAEIENLLEVKRVGQLTPTDCLNRMVYVMINEAARCLEEGVIAEASDADIGMIMGTGFPPFRGGLLRYADSVGIDNIVETLDLYNNRYQTKRFTPCDYLRKLKSDKRKFYN